MPRGEVGYVIMAELYALVYYLKWEIHQIFLIGK